MIREMNSSEKFCSSKLKGHAVVILRVCKWYKERYSIESKPNIAIYSSGLGSRSKRVIRAKYEYKK